MKKVLLVALIAMFGFTAFAQQAQASDYINSEEEYSINMSPKGISDDVLESFLASVQSETPMETRMLLNEPERITASILALFLGDLGIQYFYLGEKTKGILSLCFCWTGIPAIIGFVQGIIWLCGSDEDFQARIAKM